MRNYLAFALIALIVSAWAADTSSGSIEVRANTGSFIVSWQCTVKAPSGVTITVQTPSQSGRNRIDQEAASTDIEAIASCDELLFETEDIDGDGATDIAVNTTGTGLHKSRSIFLFDSSEKVFVYAGRLPIAADLTGPYKYRLIESQGGSVFETLLKIEDRKIREYPQWELVLDRKICVSKNKTVIPINGKCHAVTVNATPKNPICIDHRSGAPHLVSQEICRELSF